MRVIAAQLGRPTRGEVLVARRCPQGVPAVVLTLPFDAGGGRVPPLLWLSCPFASRGISELESRGLITVFAERLSGDPGEMELFLDDEERFAAAFSVAAAGSGAGFYQRLGARGAAGGRPGVVKCLHAHLAYMLATAPVEEETRCPDGRQPGLVGGWCFRELESRSGVWCDRKPEACLDRHRD